MEMGRSISRDLDVCDLGWFRNTHLFDHRLGQCLTHIDTSCVILFCSPCDFACRPVYTSEGNEWSNIECVGINRTGPIKSVAVEISYTYKSV